MSVPECYDKNFRDYFSRAHVSSLNYKFKNLFDEKNLNFYDVERVNIKKDQ